ncbi:MAG TPA: TPM domain-containing protein [Ramlibacter sp.]|nr:TPM domain-containing protein [Ramlibacter sp.]
MKRLALLVAWVLAFLAVPGFAQNLQPIPPLTAHVIDQTGTLDAIQVKGLEEKLSAFEKEKGTQVAILMLATTQPEDIASFANRVGNSWKIGRKEVGDGVIVIVAKDDRKVRIEVAKTLEGAIPDLAAKNIIDDAITPNFRKGDYAGGLRAAVDQLTARISGEKLPEPKQQPSKSRGITGGFDWFDLAIFFFFAVPIAGAVARQMLGRSFGTLVTGGVTGGLALLLTSSMIIAGVAAFIALLYSAFAGTSSGFGSRRGGTPWIIGGGGGDSSGSSWGGGGGGDSWGGSGGGGDFGGGGASGDW